MIKKWNKETCTAESKKFKTKIEWLRSSKGSYEAARLNGWLNELSAHMVKAIPSTKVCRKCSIEKERSFFNRDYSVKNGLRSICKDCKKEENAKNRKKIDKEAKKIYMKEYAAKNKEKINTRHRNYRLKNPQKVRAAQRTQSVKKLSKINYKLSNALRNRIRRALKNNQKLGSAVKDLGCSIEELKLHLESKFCSGMSWDNWGRHGWHLDHIIPLSSFDLTDRKQFLKACHYTNLQPLWAVDNLKKYNKLMESTT